MATFAKSSFSMKVLLIKGSRDGHCVLLRALAVLSSARCTFLWISADLFGGIELKMYLCSVKNVVQGR